MNLWTRTWLLVFGYSVFVACTIQFILLPILIPSWHAGDGLMIGGDWIVYHKEAIDLSEAISRDGWGAWELRYESHSLSGILGALYALTWPKPWAFVPFAAALHATACISLMLMLARFTKRPRSAVLAGLPFALFPTALLWITQPLKDGLSICGFMLFVLGWFVLLDMIRCRKAKWSRSLLSTGLLLGGALLIWVARPYLLVLLQVFGTAAAAILSLSLAYLTWKRRQNWRVAQIAVLVLAVGLLGPSYFPQGSKSALWEPPAVDSGASASVESDVSWTRSGWLPGAIDGFLQVIAEQRDRSRTRRSDAGSDIDQDLALESSVQVLTYIPRAIQIALFSPFPAQWIRSGSSSDRDVMRLASAAEMLFSYLMVPCCLWGIWLKRRKPETWLLFVFCGVALVIQPLFVANVGTIVRMRYPYFMSFVCLGFATLLEYGPKIVRRIRSRVIR